MQIVLAIVAVILAYVIGSVPVGLLIVKIATGKDIREVESGRTGGTNAMRAAGFWAGFATAMLDIVKGAAGVWVARWLTPEMPVIHMIAPLAAILGHNHSIFLPEPITPIINRATKRLNARGLNMRVWLTVKALVP